MEKLSALQPVTALTLLFALLILSGISKGASRPYPARHNTFIACTTSKKDATPIGKKRKGSKLYFSPMHLVYHETDFYDYTAVGEYRLGAELLHFNMTIKRI